ncbi:MAG TPA: sulfurtransferase [Terracidiphilus sp.]|nr:sulfurtransferase [Terracidiphilus sp.]
MLEKEAMLREMTSKAALPLIGAAVLSTAFQRVYAQDDPRPTVRTEMLVSTTWLQQHLNDHDLIVVYIGRDRSQFDSGHIPGSRFVRLDELVEQHKDSLNELPSVEDLQATFESLGVSQQSRLILADDTGGVLAARAFFTLDYLGLGDHAALLDGGMKTWKAELRRTSKEEPLVARAEFIPHVHRDILVSTAQMRRLSFGAGKGVSDYALLDARPVAEHTGIVNSESISQSGHIAGSRSLYWKRLIRSDADPQLLSPEELQQRFQDAGAGSSRTVVTYCRTGMQSSFTYFVARYLGYRAAMYDGSIYEWVRTAGNILVRSPALQRATATHQQKHLTR